MQSKDNTRATEIKMEKASELNKNNKEKNLFLSRFFFVPDDAWEAYVKTKTDLGKSLSW